MHRNVTQCRIKGDPNSMLYAPQRDLANLFMPMLKEVLQGLDEKNITPVYADLLKLNNITPATVGEYVQRLVDTIQSFIRDPSIRNPTDAFVKSGLLESPEMRAVMPVIMARIGETLLAGFCIALRDVTLQNEPSAVQADMAEMIAAGRQLTERLSGKLTDHPVDDVMILRATIEEQNRVINQARGTIETLSSDYGLLQSHTASVINGQANDIKELAARLDEARQRERSPLWSKLKSYFSRKRSDTDAPTPTA